MKTIKELIEFARANPQFFTEKFNQQVSQEVISFGSGKYAVNCESAEIITQGPTRHSPEEIKNQIFKSLQAKLTLSMQSKINERGFLTDQRLPSETCKPEDRLPSLIKFFTAAQTAEIEKSALELRIKKHQSSLLNQPALPEGNGKRASLMRQKARRLAPHPLTRAEVPSYPT